MFTGIVSGIATVVSIKKTKKTYSYIVEFSLNLYKNLKVGDSVAHNGCCLTVKKINVPYVEFDVLQETLKITNLGMLGIGDQINIERSVKYGDEIGGHIISGHITNTAEIFNVLQLNNDYILWLEIKDMSLMKYIFFKGFICVDGISLTINDIIKNKFCVCLIPQTLSSTTIKNKKNGYLVNIEIDFYTRTTVDTVQYIMNQNIIKKHTGILKK